ncbi:dysbindin protein homolog [Phlebotomus argentipes]|uniref:dysbindin protein homolog n=1 Tax=Phlebotomus argentipes TaxID=94469 RepID=UPI002893300C|nr:dysbindin protein homolog [Phlebotomus argentipes]
MFGNIRKKLNSVIQEGLSISENISSHYIKPSSPKTPQSPATPTGSPAVVASPQAVPPFINLYAGCDLLAINERQWSEIRDLNEQNAKKASEIDGSILELKDRTERTLTTVQDLNVTLAALPVVVTTLNGCVDVIRDVGAKCETLEKKMMELEDLLEVLELQEKQLDHRFEMAMYKEKKLGALEKVREELAKKHSDNVMKHELKMRKVQQERQSVFQDAFQDDMKFYREQGTIPKVETKAAERKLSLEEVELDDTDTKDALDEFLNN